VHVDRAIARQQGDGEQILGGPIVNIGGWAPQDEGRGARATREAIADIDGYANAAGDERFVTLS
jgi:hypothetical protein